MMRRVPLNVAFSYNLGGRVTVASWEEVAQIKATAEGQAEGFGGAAGWQALYFW